MTSRHRAHYHAVSATNRTKALLTAMGRFDPWAPVTWKDLDRLWRVPQDLRHDSYIYIRAAAVVPAFQALHREVLNAGGRPCLEPFPHLLRITILGFCRCNAPW